jgi:hypothetical protein
MNAHRETNLRPRRGRSHLLRGLARAFPVLALTACAPPPSPPAPMPPPSEAPRATASATSAAPVAPVAPPSPFSIFAEGWDVTVADTHGPVVIHDSLLGAMITVEGERVARVEAPFRRLPTGPGVSGTITGSWPEGALLTTRSARALQQFFRRTNDTWEAQRITNAYGRGYFREAYIEDLGVTYHVAGPYAPSLGAMDVAGPDGRSMVFMWPTRPEHPVLSLGGDGKPGLLGLISMDAKRASIKQVAASRSGEVAVLATYLAEKTNDYAWMVERWHVGHGAHSVTEVAGARGAQSDSFQVSMCLAPDGTLHAVRHDNKSGVSGLLTWHGSSWSSTKIPGTRKKGPISRCAVGRDGSIWFLLDNGEELYRKTPESTLERVYYPPLPPPTRRLRIHASHVIVEPVPVARQAQGTFSGTDIHVADEGSVWVAGVRKEGGRVVDTGRPEDLVFERRVVLRLGAPLPGTPIDWDGLQAGIIEDRLATFDALAAFDALASSPSDLHFSTGPVRHGCAPAFARLMTLPKKSPTHEDFPAVRVAVQGRADLVGVRFVEGRIENTHVLGALAPNLDAGRRVISALKRHIPHAGARVYCGRPHIVRVIPMGIPEKK